MVLWQDFYSYFSFFLYICVVVTNWRSKNRHFDSSFFRIFLVIGVIDLASFAFFQMNPLLQSSPPGRTILQIFLQLFRTGHCMLSVVMSLNRLTSVLYPLNNQKIWEEKSDRNLKRAIGFAFFFDFLSQCHSITFIFLWGWKDSSLSYPQIPSFDAWHRLYYAVLVTTVAALGLSMNVITVWKMSMLGITIFSTLIQIPAALFFSTLSYTAFTGNPLELASLIGQFSSLVALFVGNYQPYWVLVTSKELRREMHWNARRCFGLVTNRSEQIHLQLATWTS